VDRQMACPGLGPDENEWVRHVADSPMNTRGTP
jgi:hypothetical protein